MQLNICTMKKICNTINQMKIPKGIPRLICLNNDKDKEMPKI